MFEQYRAILGKEMRTDTLELGFALRMKRTVVALLILLFAAVTADAQPVRFAESEALLNAFSASAEDAEKTLSAGRLDDVALDELRAQIEEQRSELSLIEEQTQTALVPLRDQLAPLVPEDGGETTDPSEAARRAALEAEISSIESLQRLGRQAVARANALSEKLNRERRERFANALLKRGPSPALPERISNMWASVSFKSRVIVREFTNRLETGPAGLVADRVALPIALALIAILLGVVFRRWLVTRLLSALGTEPSAARKASLGAGVMLSRLLVPMLAVVMVFAGLNMSGLVGPVFEKVLSAIFQGAVVVIATYAMSGAYFAPGSSALRISSLEDRPAARAHRWLIIIAFVIALDRVFVGGGREIGLSIDALGVLNAGLLIIGGIALALFVHHARLGLPAKSRDQLLAESDDQTLPRATLTERAARFARFIARAVAVIAPLLALIGYFGASRFAFYPPVLSGALICVCVLVYDVVAAGTATATAKSRVGLSDQDAVDTPAYNPFGIVPVFVGFLLFMAVLPLLAMIWGADLTDLEAAWSRTLEGFVIGEVRLSPIDFVLFVIVFMIGYMLTRSVQGVLRRSVLPLTRMDQGAQSALTAGLGYVGITISALIAISTTGLDLSNIAIVAGALSVGIGFGLQNIVNNFVSGIILLIERPIKAGDWVEIGGVHGTVQQVNVRSTEITTFDRSTMFVPNADLISGTVTNWTHADSMGRLIVPVGAAYGSDARHVEKVLLEIARAHPSLLRRPEPYVVFSGFGADSIDFEIRGVLRDVNGILTVASDIRYSVYERFADENIEIPFAQRDVFIKNLDALKKS